jgi:hypothetical protein
VFLPGIRGRVRASRGGAREHVSFQLERRSGAPLTIDEVVVRPPSRRPPSSARAEIAGEGEASVTLDGDHVRVGAPVRLRDTGDGIAIACVTDEPLAGRSTVRLADT